MLHPFVFAAEALPVCYRTKNLGTEQAVALRLESSIVDRFRFGDFALRPGTNLLGGSQTNLNAVKISNDIASIVGILSKQGKPPLGYKREVTGHEPTATL